MFWMIYCDHLRINYHPEDDNQNRGMVWSINWLFFVVLEDFPQMILQTTNNLLIGQTLTWVQVTSPMIGLICACVAIIDMIFIFYGYLQIWRDEHE